MKTLLLFAFAFPATLLAQSGEATHPLPAGKYTGTKPLSTITRTTLNKQGKKPDVSMIGYTNFDLQTNASVARRVWAYPDGKISVVFTSSFNDQNQNFPSRGTGYNF